MIRRHFLASFALLPFVGKLIREPAKALPPPALLGIEVGLDSYMYSVGDRLIVHGEEGEWIVTSINYPAGLLGLAKERKR